MSVPSDVARARYEVRIEPAEPPAPRLILLRRAAIAIVLAGLSYAAPYALGVPVVLPVAFVALGLWIASRRPPAPGYTVRFFDDVLEIQGAHHVARTPWEHVPEVRESEAGLVVVMPGGASIEIPKRHVPQDRRVWIDAMPSSVRIVTVPAPAPPKHDARKTLVLWVCLITAVCVVYQLLGDR